jgi:hypothetical protein
MSELAPKLTAFIAELKQRQANNFAPARFIYIETLLIKAQTAKSSIGKALKYKVELELNNYQQDFSQALQKSKTLAQQTIKNNPASAAQIEQLLLNCQFMAIERLAVQLQPIEASPIARLNDYINQELSQSHNEQQISFSDMLSKIESKAVKNYQSHSQQQVNKKDQEAELKSFNSFKQFKGKYDTDKLVEQIITLRPANLGPLNSHMLLIKSLESMRDLSPQYLSRFMTYIDALLRLEDANNSKLKKQRIKNKKRISDDY